MKTTSHLLIIICHLVLKTKNQNTGFYNHNPKYELQDLLKKQLNAAICKIYIFKGKVDLKLKQKEIEMEELRNNMSQIENFSELEKSELNEEILKAEKIQIDEKNNFLKSENSEKNPKNFIKNQKILTNQENTGIEILQNYSKNELDFENGQSEILKTENLVKVIKTEESVFYSILSSCDLPGKKVRIHKLIKGFCGPKKNFLKIENSHDFFLSQISNRLEFYELFENEEEKEIVYYLGQMFSSENNSVGFLEGDQCEIVFEFVRVFLGFYAVFIFLI